jgi:hypothetical protein
MGQKKALAVENLGFTSGSWAMPWVIWSSVYAIHIQFITHFPTIYYPKKIIFLKGRIPALSMSLEVKPF